MNEKPASENPLDWRLLEDANPEDSAIPIASKSELEAEINLTALVVEFHGDVYRYAFRLSGSSIDAEDLTQQTFLSAQIHLDQLRDPSLARPWLFAILRNTFFKSRRKQQPELISNWEREISFTPQISSAEEWVDYEQVQLALNELPTPFRTVLLMYYFEKFSYQKIAKELNLPLGTVMSRLSRAKEHLKRHLPNPGLGKIPSRAS